MVLPGAVSGHGLGRSLRNTNLGRYLQGFVRFETFILKNPRTVAVLVALVLMVAGTLYRALLVRRNSRSTEKTTGLRKSAENARLPVRRFNPIPHIARRPKGATFVGMTPSRRWWFPWGYRLDPVYLS